MSNNTDFLDNITANPFRPDYTPDQIGEIIGYSKALQDFYQYIKVITEHKPEKRYIDSVPLLDGISKASGQISKLLKTKIII